MLRPVTTRPVVVLLALCALAGCGDGGTSDEEQVRATLAEFQRATEAGDHRALCERVLAPDLVETVEQIGLSCESALAKATQDVRDPRLSVGAITVDDDAATAQVRSSAAGQAPSEDTIRLVKVGEEWRIASLGGGEAP